MNPQNKQLSPWQERKKIGFFEALWQTIKKVLFKPAEFFERLEISDTYLEPLSFYFIVFTVSIVISALLEGLLAKALSLRLLLVMLITLPATALLAIYIFSGAVHLLVRLFKGEGDFKATFNVICYGSSASVFFVIPFIGHFIGGIWWVVVGLIGLKRMHKIDTLAFAFSYLFLNVLMVLLLLSPIIVPNFLKAKIKANELIAQTNCYTINKASQDYYTENSRYPFFLSELAYKGAINERLAGANDRFLAVNGYYYIYQFKDKDHYDLEALPKKPGITGKNIYQIDETGVLRNVQSDFE